MPNISSRLHQWLAVLAGSAICLFAAEPLWAQAEAPVAPATAQTQLPAHDYRHPHAGITLPSDLAGYSLTKSQQLYADSLDTATEYRIDDQSTFVSVYIFRNASGNVPIWFDRAQASLFDNAKLGPVTPTIAERSFTPPGQSSASGMRVVYTAAQSSIGIKSTAIVLLPVNGWYVKLRLSSHTMDAAALDGLIDKVLGQIRFPAKIQAEPAAVAIAGCSDALAFAKNAKAVRQSKDDRMKSAVLGSLLDNVTFEEAQKETDKEDKLRPPTWCRDASSTSMLGVYRANGATNGYLLGLADSGRAISHGVDGIMGALGQQKKAAPTFAVNLIIPDQRITYTPLDGLAGPEQLYHYIEQAQPISTKGTWGKGANKVTIGT